MPIGRRVTIISITGGSSSSSPTDVESGHPWVIAIVSGGIQNYCRLPSGAEIGDVVEMYSSGDNMSFISPPDGEAFLKSDASPKVRTDAGTIFRKVSATKWGFVQSETTP